MKGFQIPRCFAAVAALALLGGVPQMVFGESFTYTPIMYPDASLTYVTGINDAGEVIGYAYLPSGAGITTQSFVYQGGAFTNLVVPGLSGAVPVALNNNGTVVVSSGGTYYEVNGSTVTPVAVPGALSTRVDGINDLGQVVGTYVTAPHYAEQGFLFNGTTYQTLDHSSSPDTYLTGINNAGQIVGNLDIGLPVPGFLYQGGTYQPISIPGVPEVLPTGINNAGEIVGTADLDGFVDVGGVFSIFTAPAGFDLESLSLPGINDEGQIAGTWLKSGPISGTEGFVGTPVGTVTPTAPTPESGTMGLVGTGVVGLAGVVRRRWGVRVG